MRDYEKYDSCDFAELKGKTISEIIGLEDRSEQIFINCTDGSSYRMMYHEDCCASCDIEDVAGDVSDLIGAEILMAEEVYSSDPIPEIKAERDAAKAIALANDEYYYDLSESETWTFYKLATIKGSVTIRWYGSSNGYYSETASFEKEIKND